MGVLRNVSGSPVSSWVDVGTCEGCGAEFPADVVGRPRRYCCNACRQKAYRCRRGPAAGMAPGAYRSGDGWALYLGHARKVLDALPQASAQTIVTSPPYFNLRDYRGHPDQIGLELTPEAYVQSLVDVFRAAARVLCKDGTFWLNVGDTYSSRANQGPSAHRHAGRGHRRGVTADRINTVSTAPLKSLLLIPSRLALALQGDGWIVRNDIIWHKTNAMPHSVADRLSNRYEHLLLLTRSQRYYFDLDAIKEPARRRAAGNKRSQQYAASIGTEAAARRFGANDASPLSTTAYTHRNPGDVWPLATRGSDADHYAMFPIELPLRCIVASTRPGDLVLDPFAGRSTTGRAALSRGRRYLGIDINAVDHDAAAADLTRITAQSVL